MDADEDKKSPRNSAQVNGDEKESVGVMKSLRRSMRREAVMSLISPKSKGSKVTHKGDTKESEPLFSPQPPSPNPSTGSSVYSPLKSAASFRGTKGDDESDVAQRKSKSPDLKTEPNLSRLANPLKRSFKSIKKVANDRFSRQQPSVVVLDESKEEEEILEEMEESYKLPDIPHTPLSVMQISRLIEMEVLEEGYLNLLALRLEFQQFSKDSPMELAKMEKDLNLLYGDLRKKVGAIIRDSNSFPSRNKGLLPHVVRIIQEEERRAEEAGGLPDSWMDAWKEAVVEGVRAKVESVHLEEQEHNTSWLSIHLGLLGKAIVEDLESVRRELRWSYPPSFNVFSTYVNSYHQVVGHHLRKLEQRVAKLKDLHALLDWIVNTYKSERVMGSVSLQPDVQVERLDLQLEDGFLTELKERYCFKVKEDIRLSLDRLTDLENEEFWSVNKPPHKDDEFLSAKFPMDIWTTLEGKFSGSRKIDAQLEQKVTSACLEELKHFPKRFEEEFRRNRSNTLCTEYQITYINSFTLLQTHIESYQEACPDQVEGFRKEVKSLILRLLQRLEDQFKEDVKPYLRRMMTRKWLSHDEDFASLYTRAEQLSEHCDLMRPPHAQEMASQLHYHVVKEYVGQLMKDTYRCSDRKRESAADKIRLQWNRLRKLFEDMGSLYEWLHPVGDDLSTIIMSKKTEIKDNIWPLVLKYPDFSKKHLMALLDFRGLRRGREHRLILQTFSNLKNGRGTVDTDQSQVFFRDIPVTVNTDFLSNLPLFCLSVLRPDS
ncbi:exocyst complex component 3-like protein 4 [Gouania willdenowi]|nr:exocyst complex component 3-like protein 4 [Gouania willdenowi]XP_028294696.1 exocyst complex component 3-like protein 4 [Gouania willdenowi]